MNSINQIEVVYHNRLVGRLALTKDNLCAFEYSAEWQNSGFSISPFELPLRSGVVTGVINTSKKCVLYVNADDIYLSNNRLLDLAERMVQRGVYHLYIDEIHKYVIEILFHRYWTSQCYS